MSGACKPSSAAHDLNDRDVADQEPADPESAAPKLADPDERQLTGQPLEAGRGPQGDPSDQHRQVGARAR